MKVEIFKLLKSNDNGNGNIFEDKNLLNGINGHYMDYKINFMTSDAKINDINAVSGTVIK